MKRPMVLVTSAPTGMEGNWCQCGPSKCESFICSTVKTEVLGAVFQKREFGVDSLRYIKFTEQTMQVR